jgi:hypothetical protein
MVESTAAAGTINHTARGVDSCATSSDNDAAASAPSAAERLEFGW